MKKPFNTSTTIQVRTLLIFLVVVGYILTFLTASWGTTHYSLPQVVIGVLFGVAFIVIGMFDSEILQHFPEKMRHVLYFSVQISLVFGIGWTLGPGGTWLIGIPLASLAVERLTALWRWPVYVTLLAAIVLPIPRYSTWQTAWMNAIVIATGIFFVVITSQLRINEQHSREKAELLARQLESANRRLVEYASQVENLAAVQERNRLAREIHDNIGHYLTIVNVQIEAARATIGSDPARALDAMDKAQELAKKGLASVRESVAALRISPLENRTLEDVIAALVEDTKEAGFNAQFTVLGTPRQVDEKAALALYRAAQEGLTNFRKHAHTLQVNLELDFSRTDKIRLAVWDDGTGAVDTSRGFGLIGMRERIQLLDGDFKVETQPGKGFHLEITLPSTEENRI